VKLAVNSFPEKSFFPDIFWTPGQFANIHLKAVKIPDISKYAVTSLKQAQIIHYNARKKLLQSK